MRGFNYKKAVQALAFFAEKEGGTINKIKALKLIWLSDRLHLRQSARPILNDVYFAMKKGAVPSGVKDLAENSDFLADIEKELRQKYLQNESPHSIKAIASPALSVFSDSDLKAMNTVYENFGALNESELSDLSHQYPEWKKFESDLNSGLATRKEMSYSDFFEDFDGQASIFNQNEKRLSASKEIFEENQIIGNLR